MASSREKIVERVKRLLALSKGSTFKDAELAAERAQKLILQYQIEESEVTNFDEEDIVRESFTIDGMETSRYPKLLIIQVIAEFNSVAVTFMRKGSSRIREVVTLHGFASDVEFVQILAIKILQKSVEEVTRLINSGANKPYKPSDFRYSFYYGVSTRLKDRFDSMLGEVGGGELVVTNKLETVWDKVNEKLEVEQVEMKTPELSYAGYRMGQNFAETAVFDEMVN